LCGAGNRVKLLLTLKVTEKELQLLSSLASDQLFRREFIDHRRPGYKSSLPDLSLGKQLVERLQLLADRVTGIPIAFKSGTAISRKSHATTTGKTRNA
jgi:hypothetical protein